MTDRAPDPATDQRRLMRGLLVLLVALLPALVTAASTVHYTGSDSQGTLLVSEQIIDRGDITLDSYSDYYSEDTYRTFFHNGSRYYYFPLGSSVASVPFVAAAKALGIELPESDHGLQLIIAALLASLIVVLLFALARRFLPFRTSLALAVVFWFGSSLASTGATALWSHDFAVVFGLIALLALVRGTTEACRWCGPVLGAALFMAYLSRPTMAILVVMAITYAAVKARRTALVATGVFGVLFLAFVLFSLRTFDAILPPYYQPGRLSNGSSLDPILGLLVSPGRGLLLFTPILLMIPVLAFLAPANIRQRWGLLVVALAWPLAHLLAVSRFDLWYGGVSFGPRLMTDALPGLFLATVLLWPPSFEGWYARAFVMLGVLLATASIYINTVQGLFNPATLDWNLPPGYDTSEIQWDWRYPQFLHSDEREAQRQVDYANGGP